MADGTLGLRNHGRSVKFRSKYLELGPKVWTENFESKLFERIMIETGLNRNAPEFELLFLQMVKVFGQKSNARLKIA